MVHFYLQFGFESIASDAGIRKDREAFFRALGHPARFVFERGQTMKLNPQDPNYDKKVFEMVIDDNYWKKFKKRIDSLKKAKRNRPEKWRNLISELGHFLWFSYRIDPLMDELYEIKEEMICNGEMEDMSWIWSGVCFGEKVERPKVIPFHSRSGSLNSANRQDDSQKRR